jgi:hypothetical protein
MKAIWLSLGLIVAYNGAWILGLFIVVLTLTEFVTPLNKETA